MKHLLVGAMIMAGTAANAQTVETAVGDWRNIPRIEAQGVHRMGFDWMDKMEALAKSRECEMPGLYPRKIDLTVPFMLNFGKDGTIQRVVVRKLGCEKLETLVGGAILQLAQAGEYRPSGANAGGWYRSEYSFVLQ